MAELSRRQAAQNAALAFAALTLPDVESSVSHVEAGKSDRLKEAMSLLSDDSLIIFASISVEILAERYPASTQ